jgi:hypothetical protein
MAMAWMVSALVTVIAPEYGVEGVQVVVVTQ